MRWFASFVLLFALACSDVTAPDLIVREGSQSAFVPVTLSEVLVRRGDTPVPYRIVTNPSVCEVSGSEFGTEAARTVTAVHADATADLELETADGVVATGTCEGMPSEGRVRLRWH